MKYFPVYTSIAFCLVFLQSLICGMILDDVRPLYLGSWDLTALVLFQLLIFVLIPLVLALLFAIPAKFDEALFFKAFLTVVAVLLAREIDYFVFREMFIERLLLRSALMVLIFGLILFLLFRFRAAVKTFIAVAPVCSLLLAVYFAYAVGHRLIAIDDGSPPAKANSTSASPLEKGHIFVLTFERVLHDHLFNAENKIDAGKFPHFARLVATSNTYHNAYAHSKGTWLALKHTYTGTYDARINEVLGAEAYRSNPVSFTSYFLDRGWRNVFVTDTATQYCDKKRAICISALGDTSMRRRFAVIKGWFQEYLKVFIPTGMLAEAGIIPTWDVLLWEDLVAMDELQRAKGFAREITTDDLGKIEMEELIAAIEEYRTKPTVFISHNLFNHGSPIPMSGLFGPVDQTAYKAARENARTKLENLDRLLGEFLAALDRLGLFAGSTIVVASDTGNDIDAAQLGDQPTAIDTSELARIFLSIKFPNQTSGADINGVVRQIDILPTVIYAQGLDPSAVKMDGIAATEESVSNGLQSRPTFLMLNHNDIYRLEKPLGTWTKVK